MVGLPADALLAAVWLIILANETGYKPGRISMVFGDTHIYEVHHQGALQYLNQYGAVPSLMKHGPKYELAPTAGFNNFTPDMLKLGVWYQAPAISFEVIA
jgi:thymidylate synthase